MVKSLLFVFLENFEIL